MKHVTECGGTFPHLFKLDLKFFEDSWISVIYIFVMYR